MTFTWFWIVWIIVTLVSFGVVEGLAVAHVKGFTPLTQSLRKWLGIAPHRPWQVPATILFCGGLLWLVLHITTGKV